MSYVALPQRRPVRPLAPSRFGPGLRGFRGLGTLMDANVLTSAWYLPLVEVLNRQTAARQYFWGDMKYLSNWDALDYNMGFTQYTPQASQESTLYQWDGSDWRKTNVGNV